MKARMRTLPGFTPGSRWDDAPDVVEHAVSVAPKLPRRRTSKKESIPPRPPKRSETLGGVSMPPIMAGTCLQLHQVAAGARGELLGRRLVGLEGALVAPLHLLPHCAVSRCTTSAFRRSSSARFRFAPRVASSDERRHSPRSGGGWHTRHSRDP